LRRLLPDWTPTGPYEPVPVHAVYAPIHQIALKTRAFVDHMTSGEAAASALRPHGVRTGDKRVLAIAHGADGRFDD